MKRQAKEENKREINQTTNTYIDCCAQESRVLMYCEILTKAKRSMNYTNWPTSQGEWKRERTEARRKCSKLAWMFFLLFLFLSSRSNFQYLSRWVFAVASYYLLIKWDKKAFLLERCVSIIFFFLCARWRHSGIISL